MSNVEGAQAAATPVTSIQSVRIVQEVPLIFADGVMSQSYGSGVSKFYLSRFDPDPRARAAPQEVVVLQVAMPIQNFVMSVAFLEHRLKTMVAENAVTQEQVDRARQYWIDNPTGAPPTSVK
jgi:hypothetical protein